MSWTDLQYLYIYLIFNTFPQCTCMYTLTFGACGGLLVWFFGCSFCVPCHYHCTVQYYKALKRALCLNVMVSRQARPQLKTQPYRPCCSGAADPNPTLRQAKPAHVEGNMPKVSTWCSTSRENTKEPLSLTLKMVHGLRINMHRFKTKHWGIELHSNQIAVILN